MHCKNKRFNRLRVLLVNADQEESATISSGILIGGHDVALCDTFLVADWEIKRRCFDLALVDIDLNPEGLAWLQRCAMIAPKMQLIIMTSDTSREQEIMARNQHITMYLVRPFSVSIIQMIINHLAEKLHGKPEEDGIMAGGIEGTGK
jgi:DNA-binding response OmpR family regulator